MHYTEEQLLKKSMDYYVKMGFAKKWDWGTPPTFALKVRRVYTVTNRFFSVERSARPAGMWMSDLHG